MGASAMLPARHAGGEQICCFAECGEIEMWSTSNALSTFAKSRMELSSSADHIAPYFL